MSKVRAVQMDNLKGLLGIWGINKVLNEQITELCGVMKGMDERIDEGVFWRFSHMETKDNKISKRVHVGE